MNQKYIWMCVEADEYELPLIVADSAKELARKMGLSVDTVTVAAYRGHSGKTTGRKFVKVRIDEEWQEQ